jgi:hypothetical protein
MCGHCKACCFAVSTTYCCLGQGMNMGLMLLALEHLFEYFHIIGDVNCGSERKTLGFKIVNQNQSLLNDVIMIFLRNYF